MSAGLHSSTGEDSLKKTQRPSGGPPPSETAPDLPFIDAPSERRRYPRAAVTLVGWLTGRAATSRRARAEATVVDLSESGALIRTAPAAAPNVGDRVTVAVPALPRKGARDVRLAGQVRHVDAEGRIGVRFDALVAEQITHRGLRRRRFVTALAATGLAALIAYLKARNIVSFWYGPLLQVYSIGAATYVLSRVGLSLVYRPPKDRGFTPSVSLIVAVKNEEAHIAETVRHCFASRYPAEKLELIVIDDGSDDGTWRVLQSLEKKYGRFRCFQFAQNRGKRHAMALGTREATGDVLVFIDSDTFLEEEALYRLVQPLADRQVGAVAGHTLVIVEKDNVISKMEAVRYYVSQRVMKAAESVFGAVTCCPGPLSAYRKAAVLPILDRWENQMFLGERATFGDDRSLTNFILRQYRVVYHAGARCATYAPAKMSVFIRQQLRWKKSWLRELTVSGRFMWKKNPLVAVAFYMAAVITLVSPIVAFGALFGFSFIGVPFNFTGYLSGLLLVYAFLGLIYHYHTASRVWLYGLLFALLYVCLFSFQNYYALLTVRRNQWGTR